MTTSMTAATPTIAARALGARAGLPAQIGLAVAGSLLLAISAHLKVQIGPVPFSFQTLTLLILAACYGRNLAVATVALYLAEGLVGLPVFTTGGGPAALMGPTAGFLIGFLPLAAIVGEAADRGLDRSPLTLAPAMLIGEIVLFALGFTWLALSIGADKAWTFGVAPFIVPDLVKIAIAALAVPAAHSALRRRT